MPTVTSIFPADDAVGVLNNQPVQVELTRPDSTDYEKVETSEADFAAGTLVDVVANPAGSLSLLLKTVDDFAADTIGQLPTGWTIYNGAGYTVQSVDAQNALKRAQYNGRDDMCEWSAMGSLADADFVVDFRCEQSGGDPTIYVRRTGAYGSESLIQLTAAFTGALSAYRYVGGSYTQIGTAAKSFSTSTWYTMRLSVVGTSVKARVWLRSGSEPSSWDINVTETNVPNAGAIGVKVYSNVAAYFDNATLLGVGSAYPASGIRVSPAYPLAAVGKAGVAYIQFDATIPAQTTLTVKTSLDGGSTWSAACTSGQRIAGITEGDDLSAISISVKAELGTSNGAVTPALLEVRLIFMPVDPTLAEVKVDGVSFTIAGANLCYWKTAKNSGGTVVDPCYQDVYVATVGQWYAYGPAGVTVEVWYDGSLLSTTTFSTEFCETYWAHGSAQFMALARGGVYDGPMSAFAHFWLSRFEDYLCRAELHYLIAEVPRGAFDARYWIAHRFATDTPASGIVGQPSVTDTPASGVGNCWQRADTPASGIVQAYLREDHAASGIVGRRVVKDDPASGIAGRKLEADTPGSGIVYEVNANNSIELRVLSVEEAAYLAALGITFE